jgi:hypothetical protein
LPKHFWFYARNTVIGRDTHAFISSALNPSNPLDNNLLENVTIQERLAIPSFTSKLSDNFNGITLRQGFDASFINNDGYFDDSKKWDLFNSQLVIKKSVVDDPSYNDFKIIKYGSVENTHTSLDSFNLSANDIIRNMEEPACIQFTREYNNLNGTYFVPILYGTHNFELGKSVDLLPDGNEAYLLPEGTNDAASILTYDENNTQVPNQIRILQDIHEKDFKIIATKGKYAVVVNNTPNPDYDNRLGHIIKTLISEKGNLLYDDSFYDTQEIERYINVCPRISALVTGGNISKVVSDLLKNDMAYLIQKNDGRLTIRRYGMEYGVHKVPSEMLTKRPEKDYSKAQENYFSSCIIRRQVQYGLTNTFDGVYYKEFLFDAMEQKLLEKYRKKAVKTYNSDLADINDVPKFAGLLMDRYCFMKQKFKISLGIDISDYELLDTVEIDLNINGRKFSDSNKFYITEINAAQDTLVIEEI